MLLATYSCSLNNITEDIADSGLSGKGTLDYPQSTNTELLPEAEEYYGNIAILAEWYAENEQFRQKANSNSSGDKINTLLYKLERLNIKDSTGNKVSFFDLSQVERKDFLKTWKTTEAIDLSKKLNRDPSHTTSGLLIKRNRAFAESINRDKSGYITVSDPYQEVISALKEAEQNEISENENLINSGNTIYSDDNFIAAVIANKYLSFSVIQASPVQLTPQTFVDRLRPNLKKGRILLALPGGWTTQYLIIFYPHKVLWDVGHTAIISKDKEEIEEMIGDSSNISVGTSTWYDLNEEMLGRSWCYKHGLALLAEVYDISWEKVKNEEGKWRWNKVMTLIDHDKVCELAESQLGKPYSNVLYTFFSKWDAPNSFICSSLAWWCVEKASGVDISDWWNPSVYPVNIYYSENVVIVDDTLE